jgi:hypothetical protein
MLHARYSLVTVGLRIRDSIPWNDVGLGRGRSQNQTL